MGEDYRVIRSGLSGRPRAPLFLGRNTPPRCPSQELDVQNDGRAPDGRPVHQARARRVAAALEELAEDIEMNLVTQAARYELRDE